MQCRGCEAACPSGVPFGHLMEGAREALARPSTPARGPPRPARATGGVDRATSWCCRATAVLLALTWVAWVGQRLHLVPRRFGLPRLSRRSLRTPLPADPDADAVLFTGLRDGRVATRRAPCRARA